MLNDFRQFQTNRPLESLKCVFTSSKKLFIVLTKIEFCPF